MRAFPAARIYFVVGAPRSGSTSLCRILDTAVNGRCLLEPDPQLYRESRDLSEGRLEAPHRVLVEALLPRIARVLDEGLVYGEKHVVWGPFIPYLHQMLRCRFVFLKRDGRDVVASLMNWHNDLYGTIYRECREEGQLSPQARRFRASLPVEHDVTDYWRPRPAAGEPLHDEWLRLSRLEMLAWSWARLNEVHLESLAAIPQADWLEVDYSGVTAEKLRDVFDFLGLEGFDRARVEAMLESRINTVREHTGREGRFPYWPVWTAEQRSRFDRLAGTMMGRLGYDAGAALADVSGTRR
jgi:hypothetical protein